MNFGSGKWSVSSILLLLFGTYLLFVGVYLAIAGLASIGLMTFVNFTIDSDFKWVLLGAALLWACSMALFWIETLRRETGFAD